MGDLKVWFAQYKRAHLWMDGRGYPLSGASVSLRSRIERDRERQRAREGRTERKTERETDREMGWCKRVEDGKQVRELEETRCADIKKK
jgi:hypothetical protein